eukprot:NODE_13787_length_1147_cov_2.430392.p2 GENE.NODE_13787_length_1147_cov_2.430392~~NODE_13787_length_1147_cov_2.430392.p2  ORF type:complete len:220 (-),score=36.94 NODE_13787_length_1147_cov_2.430392:486-1091(-)
MVMFLSGIGQFVVFFVMTTYDVVVDYCMEPEDEGTAVSKREPQGSEGWRTKLLLPASFMVMFLSGIGQLVGFFVMTTYDVAVDYCTEPEDEGTAAPKRELQGSEGWMTKLLLPASFMASFLSGIGKFVVVLLMTAYDVVVGYYAEGAAVQKQGQKGHEGRYLPPKSCSPDRRAVATCRGEASPCGSRSPHRSMRMRTASGM